jgi:hypothetical protein
VLIAFVHGQFGPSRLPSRCATSYRDADQGSLDSVDCNSRSKASLTRQARVENVDNPCELGMDPVPNLHLTGPSKVSFTPFAPANLMTDLRHAAAQQQGPGSFHVVRWASKGSASTLDECAPSDAYGPRMAIDLPSHRVHTYRHVLPWNTENIHYFILDRAHRHLSQLHRAVEYQQTRWLK